MTKKLYHYNEDYYYGEVSFFIFATDEEIDKLYKSSVYWHDKVGKHSEGVYDFSKDTIKFVDIPTESVEVLLKVSGIPFLDVEEVISELEEEDDE